MQVIYNTDRIQTAFIKILAGTKKPMPPGRNNGKISKETMSVRGTD